MFSSINAILKSPHLGVRNGLADINWTYDQLHTYGTAFPGQVFQHQGNLYQLVQNRSGGALTVGMPVSLLIGDSARTGNLTNDSTKAVVVTDDTLDANLAGNRAFPGRIFTTAGALATTAAMVEREILTNSTATGASTVTVSKLDRLRGPNEDATTGVDAYGTLPDNTYDYSVFCGWEVTGTDIDALATSVTQGIVVSTSITDNYFGIIQIAGVAMANVDGTTDLVAGDVLVPGTTAGLLTKWVITDGGAVTVGAEILRAHFTVGRILDAYTADSAGLRAIVLENRPLIAYS